MTTDDRVARPDVFDAVRRVPAEGYRRRRLVVAGRAMPRHARRHNDGRRLHGTDRVRLARSGQKLHQENKSTSQ